MPFPIVQAASFPDSRRLQHIYEYDGNNCIYEGAAQPGSLTSAKAWEIVKRTYDGAGNVLTEKYAEGPEFSAIWDNRAGLTYK